MRLCPRLLAVLLLLPSLLLGFGVDLASVRTNGAAGATCVPVNFAMYRMTQPDGVRRFFLHDEKDPDLLNLLGRGPWIGVRRPERDMVNVVTRPGAVPDETEFCFVGGRLRFMSVGSEQHEFDPAAVPAAKPDVSSLWPRADAAPDPSVPGIWSGSGRLTFLSRNPNRSALLFAHLALLALGAALFARGWWGRALGAAGTLLPFVLLLLTESRGGLLAFVAGAAAEVWFRFRGRWPRRVLAAAFLSGVLAAGAVLLTADGRRVLADRLRRDDSMQSRVLIWRAFPAMFAAAPTGWGWGRSGFSYNDWFEDLSRHHSTGDLFNDHLSRLAEFGLPGGAAYLFLWFAVLFSAGALAGRGRTPVPLAVWTALGVAGCFNPVQVWGWAWVAPVATLPLLRPGRRALAWAGVAALFALAGCWAAGRCLGDGGRGVRACRNGARVCFGGVAPERWVVDDGHVLDGGYPGFLGKELRTLAAKQPGMPPVGVVRHPADLPPRMKVLVLAGRSAERFLEMSVRPVADRIVFLSPPFGPDRVPEDLRSRCETLLVCGEFAATRMGITGDSPDWMFVVGGAELYVPDWTELLLR